MLFIVIRMVIFAYDNTMLKKLKIMATNKLFSSVKLITTLLLLLLVSFPVGAQYLRTSYFMDGVANRLQLNPALTPTRGYVNFPVIGAFNVSAVSNTLGSQDIYDVIDNNSTFYNNQKFMDRLTDENRLNVSLNTDVISFGFYSGKNFWSFNVGARVDIGAKIPKSMFEFLRDMDSDAYDWNNSDINVQKEELNINAYTEVGLGYARAINDRLTIGGKFKVLLGMGNLKLNVNQIKLKSNLPSDWNNLDPSKYDDYSAEIVTDAYLESSFKGMELTENTEGGKRYIDDFDFNGYGIAGYGGAIDLGASYRLLDNLTLSAAVVDLGFISWSKGSTSIANTNETREYGIDKGGDMQDFIDIANNGDVLDFELLNLQKEPATKSRTSSLHSTMVLGAEYGILNNKIGFGVLSTTRFTQPKTITELTLSANIRPKSWFNIAASYSMLQSSGKSFGLALKLGPLFVGTDYMYLGKNSKSVNAFLGISIPLGGKKSNPEG